MQEGAASESSPRDAHVVQGLGPGPFGQGLLSDLQQDSAAPFALPGAHDMHAPLVGCVSAALTRNGVDDLGLFAVLADDEMADEDGAVHADTGAQAVETGVVRLYGVVLLIGE
jgi:hypothetical protein